MTTKQKYRVLVGINYGPKDTRAEVGAVVADLPARSIPWLLEQGLIEAVVDESTEGASDGSAE